MTQHRRWSVVWLAAIPLLLGSTCPFGSDHKTELHVTGTVRTTAGQPVQQGQVWVCLNRDREQACAPGEGPSARAYGVPDVDGRFLIRLSDPLLRDSLFVRYALRVPGYATTPTPSEGPAVLLAGIPLPLLPAVRRPRGLRDVR